MADLIPLFVILLAFGAVTSVVFVAGQYFSAQMQLQRRVGGSMASVKHAPPLADGIHNLVSKYFDEKKFGVEGAVRTKLRRDLVRAGYFRPDAVNYYIFLKLAVVAVVPILGYFATELLLPDYRLSLKLVFVGALTGLAVLAPDGYVARRQRRLTAQYRVIFPDLLDLLVVCVQAGLSLEASINRLSSEMLKRSRNMGMNLLLLEAEIRAGRTVSDSLQAFAERLGLEEARSFVAMLRQSIELGTNIGDTLRVFSDEMRDRRLMRAEERANQLPVKMILPLGGCIFPVILMTVLLPIILRLLGIMKTY
jgi:tight adherence protein C